ncbi:hypothetical protein BaRGS_00026822, partial [Batillaria attramentaria]
RVARKRYDCDEPGRYRMENTRVTVDGQTCFNITDVRYLPEKIDRSCHTKLTGRKVRLSGFGSVSSIFGNTLNLCELQVWVCKPGHYGDRCLYTCSSQCQGGQTNCDSNGDCTDAVFLWKVAACLQGRFCSIPGCVGNWGRPKCTECDATHYGQDCREKCGHCNGGERCNPHTGVCPRGCAPGWRPDDKCQTRCEAGTYGPSCQGKCSEGCAADCDDMSGHCDCKPGWQHSDKCENKCEEGTYGHDCNMTCGHCAESSACERDTGRCTQGCVDGFEGDNCHGCEAGTYGPSCQGKCSEGCASDCDDMSGHCDCKPGWQHSDKCETKCHSRTYGHNCNMTCGYCAGSSVCEQDTGHCTQGCADGFWGDNCHDVAPMSSGGLETWHIVTIVFAGLTIIALTSVATFCVTRWRERKASGDVRQEQGLPLQNMEHNRQPDSNDNRRNPDGEGDQTYDVCQPPPSPVEGRRSSPVNVGDNRGQATPGHATHVMQPLAEITWSSESRDASPYASDAQNSSVYENSTDPSDNYEKPDLRPNRDTGIYTPLKATARKGGANKQ